MDDLNKYIEDWESTWQPAGYKALLYISFVLAFIYLLIYLFFGVDPASIEGVVQLSQ